MKRLTSTIGAALLSAMILLVPSAGDAIDRVINCGAGQSIGAVLRSLSDGDTLKVTGTCSENVSISSRMEGITLDGQGTATINGTDANANTINIAGRRITIRGFTITGGIRGVFVNRGAEATIDGNVIGPTGGEGVQVFNGSSARILNNTIQNNPDHGIFVVGTSIADIGVTSGAQTVPDTNTIQGNTGNGILIDRSSSARIKGNIIANNGSSGIQIDNNSTADTSSNTINGNGDNGIHVLRNSSIRLGRDTGETLQSAPNSTTAANTGNGVRCRINGSVDGRLGTLNGTVLAVDIAGGCTDSTIP